MKGFVQAGQIIIFLFILGGAFKVIEKTGAIAVGVQKTAFTFAKRPELQKYFIPITVTIFSLGGAIFGMCEETIPFVLIFIPICISLDTIPWLEQRSLSSAPRRGLPGPFSILSP